MRNTVQEVAGTIERVDDEAGLPLLTLYGSRLLHDKAPSGPRRAKLIIDGAFGSHIRLADEVCGSFAAYLKMLDLAEITTQAAARLARGFLHHADQSGYCGHFSLYSVRTRIERA